MSRMLKTETPCLSSARPASAPLNCTDAWSPVLPTQPSGWSDLGWGNSSSACRDGVGIVTTSTNEEFGTRRRPGLGIPDEDVANPGGRGAVASEDTNKS